MAVTEDLVHGWHSTHCGRGTSDILWSCLSTILICVWTAIHLPVPCCSNFEDSNLIPGEPSRSLRNWIIRSGIVPAVISVIAPELLTLTALAEFYEAWMSKKKMTKMKQMKWTLTHSFFLHMGGFCLESPSGSRLQLSDDDLFSAIPDSPAWLSQLKNVTDDHIDDHAKSNPLTKVIACGQALWLVTQVISRIYQHKAITLLEVSTLAYAICALTAYVAWWKKPQNSALPITILCSDEAIPKSHKLNPVYYGEASTMEHLWAGQHWLRHLDYPEFQSYKGLLKWGLIPLCLALFGAIHVASWNITLPSGVEQWLWRASALYCCAAGGIMFVELHGYALLAEWFWFGDEMAATIMLHVSFVIPPLYVLLRLYMIFEVFFSLRALPQSAYESVRWSSFVPHI